MPDPKQPPHPPFARVKGSIAAMLADQAIPEKKRADLAGHKAAAKKRLRARKSDA